MSRTDKGRIWARCVLTALVLSVGFGVGLFSVAPDGQIAMAGAPPAHDPSKYLWFFQFSSWEILYVVIAQGVIFGPLVSLPAVLPGMCIAAALLVSVRPLAPFAQRMLSLRPVLFFFASGFVGWFIGLAVTIVSGEFPGICC